MEEVNKYVPNGPKEIRKMPTIEEIREQLKEKLPPVLGILRENLERVKGSIRRVNSQEVDLLADYREMEDLLEGAIENLTALKNF